MLEPKSSVPVLSGVPGGPICYPDLGHHKLEAAVTPTENKAHETIPHEALRQITDIHWITEKMLNILHDIHQDHLAAKINQKMKEASADKVKPGLAALMSPGRGNLMSRLVSSSPQISQTPLASTSATSQLSPDIMPALSHEVKASVTEAMEQMEDRLLSCVRGEFSSHARTISTHSKAMNVHVDALQAASGKIDKSLEAASGKIDKSLVMLVDRPGAKEPPVVTTAPNENTINLLLQRLDSVDRSVQDALAASKSSPDPRLSSAAAAAEGREKKTRLRRKSSAGGRGPVHLWSAAKGGGGKDEKDESAVSDLEKELLADAQNSLTADDDHQADYHAELALKGSGMVPAPPKLKEDSSFSSVFHNDTDLGKPLYDVESLYKEDGCVTHIVKSSQFDAMSSFAICLNAVYLGVDADHNDAENLYDAALAFVILENAFCLYFAVEFALRILAFKHAKNAFHDGWIRFDAFLVGSMVAETWILMPLLKLQGGGLNLPLGILRLLRLLKMTRMARMMKAFPELVTMVKALVRSIRAITGTLFLLVVFLYTWSIFIHMILKSEDTLNDMLRDDLQFEFSTIPHCMWTLSMCGVFMLDGAANIATHLVWSNKWPVAFAGWMFLIFTLLTAMTILQMLIGVLCEVISNTNRDQEASKVVAIMKQQLMRKLSEHDDGDGKITQTELIQILHDPESKALLRSLNINRLFLMEMQKLMFPTKESAVSFKPLTEIILNCRGDNNATVDTVAGGLSYIADHIKGQDDKIHELLTMIDDITFHLGVEQTDSAVNQQ
jgi:hypothetical protein